MANLGVTRELLLLIGLIAVAMVAGFSKPFHIDDAADLQHVEQVMRAPLDPYGFELDWDQGPRPAIENYHPPLKYYYQAAWLSLFPLSEWSLHLAHLPFLGMIVLSVYSLSRRFGAWPGAATAAFLLSPGFLPGQNAMLDVPVMGLCLAATAYFVQGVDHNRHAWLIIAGLLLGLGLLTKYSALMYPAIWVGYAVSRRRLRPLLALAPALGLLVGWCALSFHAYGLIHPMGIFSRAPGQSFGGGAMSRFQTGVVFLGAAMPGAIVLFVFHHSRWKLAALLLSFLAAIVWSAFQPPVRAFTDIASLSPINLAWWHALAATGLAILVWTGCSGPDHEYRSDCRFLFWWFAVTFAAGVFASPFLAMRRIVDGTVPLWMLLTRQTGVNPPSGRWIVSGAVTLNCVLGLAVAAADYEFAAAYREFAAEVSEASGPDHRRMWCIGYWGWYHYSQKEGLQRYVQFGPEPPPGDRLIVPDVAAKPSNLPESLRTRLRRMQKFLVYGRIPIRIMHFQTGAGFYSNAWGPLPYTWSTLPIEAFHVFEVTPGPSKPAPQG